MRFDRRHFLATTACAFAAPFAALGRDLTADPSDGDPSIVEVLGKSRKDAKLPGLVGAIVEPGKPLRIGAVGVRKEGSPDPFTSGDVVHLGSCTKAMTATMIATLVEENALTWGTTLGEVFPDAKLHPDFRGVTLTQLLTHRAGLPPNVNWWSLAKGKATTEQRREALVRVASKEPKTKPGSKMEYSNVGYAIAGLMAETRSKKSWEDLMRDRLFRPLGMESAGFGPPGTKGKVDQPWGHGRVGEKLIPNQADNAPALGPAGTVRCTVADWSKFADLHIRGARGEKTPLLKPETFKSLQTPAKGEDYAMGWGVSERKWAGGTVLTHSGSNTSWFAVVWLGPKKNVGYLAVTNCAGDPATKATDAAIAGMIGLKG